jgi:hypothetical protein
MAGIGDVLLKIFGHNPALVAAFGGGGGPAQPQPPAAAAGAPVPNEEPAKPPMVMNDPIPESMKSPPDLFAAYQELVKEDQRRRQINEGLTTIAAGFASPENAQQLLSGLNSQESSAPSIDDILKMQKYQDEQTAQQLQLQQLGALGQQYNLDPATLKYLQSTGGLNDVIKDLAVPDNEVVETANGTRILVNKTTGKLVRTLSAAAPRETEFQKLGDGSQVLVYKDDKTEVKTGKQLTDIAAPAETKEVVKAADGSNHLIGKETGKDYGTVTEAADPETIQVTHADGSVTLNRKSDGKELKKMGAPKEADIDTVTYANGTLQFVQNGKLLGKPFGVPKDTSTDDQKEYIDFAKSEIAAGKSPTPFHTWYDVYKSKAAPGQKGVWDPGTGRYWPDPPDDMSYQFNPDGSMVLDSNTGVPKPVAMAGTKRAEEQAKAAAERKAAEDAAAAGKSGKIAKVGLIDTEIDRALNTIDANKDSFLSATGWGAALGSWRPDSPQGQVAQYLNTIKTNVGFEQLQQMRNESPTGAALGPVSDFENKMLQAVQGSLVQTQNGEELKYNLERVRRITSAIVHGYKGKKLSSQSDFDELMANIPKPPSLGGATDETKKSLEQRAKEILERRGKK